MNTQKNVRVDISDPDDTLVFRAEAFTSKYGIAVVDWPVPARLRLGEYTLNATLPDEPDTHQTASATLRLSRYDLPTFVVSPVPDRPFYIPGNDAIVDVRANYLFGKPVLHGHVRVVREDDRTWNFADQRYDVKEGKPVSGELDAHGSFKAHISLTADLERNINWDPSNDYEDIHLAAYVTDASDRPNRTAPLRPAHCRAGSSSLFDCGRSAQGIATTSLSGSQHRRWHARRVRSRSLPVAICGAMM